MTKVTNTLYWTAAYPAGITELNDQSMLGGMASRLNKELSFKPEKGKDEGGLLPFINLPFWPSLKEDLKKAAPKIRKFKHMLLLGIGGSALGARALQKSFFSVQDMPGHQGPWLWILDNVDALSITSFFNNLPPEETLLVVVSKSGGTIETASQYLLAKEWLKGALGESWTQNVLFVTGDQGALHEDGQTFGIEMLPVPTHLGGRYSILSAVGLVPAVFMGIDPEELVSGALSVTSSLFLKELGPQTLKKHPAWSLALWNVALMRSGFNQLIFFSYIPSWSTFGAWFVQLWAESLGKWGNGSMPIAATGVTDQHSTLQMFMDGPRDKGCLFLDCPSFPNGPSFPKNIDAPYEYLSGKPFGSLLSAEALGTRMALCEVGVPLVELSMGGYGPYQAGQLIALLELTTLLTGWILDINPLDQPAVELGKRLAKARLGAEGLEKEKEKIETFLETPKSGQEF